RCIDAEMVGSSHRLTAEERKERKRSQNRINQRAHRHRVKEQQEDNSKNQKLAYRVNRWRITECPAPESSRPDTPRPGKSARSRPHLHNGNGQVMRSETTTISESLNQGAPAVGSGLSHDLKLHLSGDHAFIRSLINQNVCQGFISNKSLLRFVATFINAKFAHIHPIPATACEIAVVRPTHQGMPGCLIPTQLQMNSPHPTWMDIFPFPVMRDNLIRHQNSFNHITFLEDLVGDMVYVMQPSARKEDTLVSTNPRICQEDDDTEIDHHGKGLILWGEPYLKESWEATPSFLRKWTWVAEGCHEIIDISNGWRMTRDEDPLEMSSRNGDQ
ncbi:hypothetical protein B0T10DRAFT_419351, partial [Thelonectria olida]